MSTLTWLADLHDRSKHMPRKPMRAEISAAARALAAARAKIGPDDPRLQVDDGVALVELVIESLEQHYERKLTVCYTIIVGLASALIITSVLLCFLEGKL